MARILITGGGGQLAKAFAASKSNLEYISLPRARLDICKRCEVQRALDIFSPSVVVNTAAYTAVDQAEIRRAEAFSINRLGAELLAEECSRNNIPLIHISTDYVFDGRTEEEVDESFSVNPIGVYGLSKAEGEDGVRRKHSHHIILRVSSLFSGHSRCFPLAIIFAALKQKNICVVSDQVSGPTSAASVVSVVEVMLDQYLSGGRVPWGTYHFSQMPYVSWFDFARAVLHLASVIDSRFASVKLTPVSTEIYGARALRPMTSKLGTGKIRQNFCLDPRLALWENDLEVAIEEMFVSNQFLV